MIVESDCNKALLMLYNLNITTSVHRCNILQPIICPANLQELARPAFNWRLNPQLEVKPLTVQFLICLSTILSYQISFIDKDNIRLVSPILPPLLLTGFVSWLITSVSPVATISGLK